jgi:CheY-like chemotaxis protein
LRILLIDDEDLVRRCTARALSDFEVVSVSSGAEALELLGKDDDFDAVLSDVMMPRMTGPQLYAGCTQAHPALAQRFVFASGSPETARAELMQVVAKTGEEHPPILLAKPSTRDALVLALYAAAANAEPRSGTFAIAGNSVTEVKTNRG